MKMMAVKQEQLQVYVRRMNMGVLDDEADHHSMAIFPGNDDHHSWILGQNPHFLNGAKWLLTGV